eukprot:g8289.t1
MATSSIQDALQAIERLAARVGTLEAGVAERDARIAKLEACVSSAASPAQAAGSPAGAALASAMGALKVGGAGGGAQMPAPPDLTAWSNPDGGTAAAANELKMDFEGKRETVGAERARELLQHAQAGRTDFTRISLANKSYTAEGAAEVAAVLQSLSAVRDADMADIIAGRMEAEALVVLRTLSDALADAGVSLRSVDLSDNALGEKGVRACGAILHGNAALEELWFNNNGISAECAAVIAEIVTAVRPTQLRLFHFFNNMSGPKGAASLAQVVELSPLLQDLRFSGTRCLSEGSLAFAQGVAALARIQRADPANAGAGLLVNLDLADNCFGEEGSALLAGALAAQPALRRLVLRDSGLGDGGVARVCAAVGATAPGLVELELSGNDMTGESIGAAADCAASKAALEHLGLEENEMGSDGARALAARLAGGGFAGQATLRTLLLGTNEVSGAGGIALAQALSGYDALTKLGMDGNMFSAGALDAITAALEAHGLLQALGDEEGRWEENDESGDEDDD